MMWVILALFLGLCFRHLLLLNGIKKVTQQLQDLSPNTNQRLTNPHQSRELAPLIGQINQQLTQKQDLTLHFQQAKQELKVQMTNISHDIRTPLASILGYFELLEDADPEEQALYLETIQRRAVLLKNLLDSYYEMARLESEDSPLMMEKIDLETALAQVLSGFYQDFQAKGMALEVSLEPNASKIWADQQLLQRVLVNLIQNVLKHGQTACTISHEKNVTKIANRLAHPEKLDAQKVFTRLYTADASRQNTGLGLTIVKMLLEKMGHEVNAGLDGDWFWISIKWQE